MNFVLEFAFSTLDLNEEFVYMYNNFLVIVMLNVNFLKDFVLFVQSQFTLWIKCSFNYVVDILLGILIFNKTRNIFFNEPKTIILQFIFFSRIMLIHGLFLGLWKTL